jgi:hypothetical protein
MSKLKIAKAGFARNPKREKGMKGQSTHDDYNSPGNLCGLKT